ncbi:Protein CREG1 [Liparis tanakae]|uniref:Protein CREG1 n=1 Tax=Liparis tanakae TaxID=230148 RepID=A0A4Z2FH37_9TELE|nr:Protein CREG1 [Liparis tanakae]
MRVNEIIRGRLGRKRVSVCGRLRAEADGKEAALIKEMSRLQRNSIYFFLAVSRQPLVKPEMQKKNKKKEKKNKNRKNKKKEKKNRKNKNKKKEKKKKNRKKKKKEKKAITFMGICGPFFPFPFSISLTVTGMEAEFAQKSLFSRHPEMTDWPAGHDWFFCRFNITQVWVLDYFGGVRTVSPEDYFQASPPRRSPGPPCGH